MSIGKMSEINKNILVAENDSGFEFTFYIEKAQVTDDTEKMMIRGIASTSNVDHDQERFAPKALEKMVNIINQKSVPLRVEHSKGQGSVIGDIKKGWLDGRNQFWIEAELDKNNKTASLIYSALKKGAQLGLSVGGRVKRAVMELSEKTGQAVKTFYDVILDEVSVTPRPANYDAWLFSKSIIKKGENIKPYYNSPLYDQFLATNPQLDYLAVFEKSIPRNSWIKVDNLLNYEPMLNFGKKSISETKVSESESSEKTKGLSEKNPTAISDILESSESTDSASSSSKSFSDNSSRSETSNSSPSSSKSSDSSSKIGTGSTDSSEDESSIETSKSFRAFKNYVVRGFGDIAKAIDQITKVLTYQSSDAPALEQENPNESQESYSDTSSTSITSSRGSIKHQRQGQENTYAEGDNEASRERGSRTSSDTTSALDQENPTEIKARRNKQGTNETTGTTVDDDWYNTVNEPTISSPSSSSNSSKTRKKWWEDTDDIQSERERSRSSSSGDTTSALDQENPTEIKRRKTLSSSISESVPTSERTVERTRSSSDSSEESDDEDSDNNKYRMPEVTRSIRNLNAIVKRLQSYQVIKSQSPQTIDEFTKATSAAVMAIGDRLEKEGKRIIGLENRIAEMIRRDEIIQKSVRGMMDQPGAKKSVSLGIPYMVDREGRRYALMAKEINIEKSIKNNKEKDFKEVYKEQLSSEAIGM